MNTCPNCGAETNDNVCPSCGFEFVQQNLNLNQETSQTEGTISKESVSEGLKGKNTKGRKWIPFAGAIIVLAIVYFAFIQPKVIKPMQDYNYAIEQLEKGNIAEAKKVFTSLGDYKDSAQQVDNCEVALGDKYLNDGEYGRALEIYEKYKDNINVTEEKKNKCMQGIYKEGVELFESGDAEKAKQKFEMIKNYSDSNAYIEKCNKAIQKAAEEAAAKKAAEEAAAKKAAEEKAAKYGKLDSSLADIMDGYIDEYSSIHAFSGSTTFGASLNLYYKDNAYGGIMNCSPSKNSVTVMFQGMEENGSAEADVNDIPGSIMVFFYFDDNPEREDLLCMISAVGNLLCAIDPSISQNDAYDPVLDAYVDEKEVSYNGFKIKAADMMQSQGVVIFKISADK